MNKLRKSMQGGDIDQRPVRVESSLYDERVDTKRNVLGTRNGIFQVAFGYGAKFRVKVKFYAPMKKCEPEAPEVNCNV